MILRAARKVFGLPAARCRHAVEKTFVPMRDGVRLETHHVWPVDVEDEPGTIVIRTPYRAGGLGAIGLAARLLAESGYHVLLQDVRGRFGSEGRFVPFENERSDGGDTLRWVADQPWSNGRIGLFGASYLAYTAWCALADAPEHVGALVSLIGSRDIYSTFYRGDAFSLMTAFEWGLSIGERERIPARRIDLDRGVAHRPVREGDRVALRTVDWLRDWIDHPRRDAFWQNLLPELPATLPPVVNVAGWHDLFLAAQLGDHEALVDAAADGRGPLPRLVIGPWAHGVPARLRWWRQSLVGLAVRTAIAHFDAHLCPERGAVDAPPVRYFVGGADTWRESTQWPPRESATRRLFLGAHEGRGQIDLDGPPASQSTLRFHHDPERPTPTIGGALLGLKGGVRDQRALLQRTDVLVYDSPPLDRSLTIAGRVELFVEVETDAEDVDLTARLVDVTPKGRATNVCDGIQRARWRDAAPEGETPVFLEPGVAQRLSIDLGHSTHTFAASHRIRVILGASNFPHFDRNPGCRSDPARATADEFRPTEQTVHHGGDGTSWLEVQVLGQREADPSIEQATEHPVPA